MASPGGLVEPVEPPPPRGYFEDIWKLKQDAAWTQGVVPRHAQEDRPATSGPSQPPPPNQLSTGQGVEPLSGPPALTTSFNGIDYTFSFPPDPVIAAGPTNLVLVTNGSVTIRNKTGGLVAATSLAAFFASVRASGENAFDPRVVYDTGSGRFFLAAVGRINNPSCTPGTCVSHFFLAVSKTSNPSTTGSGDWHLYGLDATLDGGTPTANFADFPDLGLDVSVVVLTANMFSFSSGFFQGAKIRILNKSLLIAGAPITWFDFVEMTDPGTSFLSFTLRSTLTFWSTGTGTFFLVSASQTAGSCNLVVWGIANVLSTMPPPTLTSRLATAGGTCNVPPNAPQLGGGSFPLLDTSDKRLLNAVYRNNSLWTAHSISMNFGSGNVSAIRWVQINVSSWPTSVSLAQDSTFGADGIYYFYPAVMVDGSNNLGIIFSRSSPSEFASAYYTGRLATDPPNTLQPSALLRAGTAPQNLIDSDGLNRWGDYLGICLDPLDASFWMLGQYATSTVNPNAWGTWVGNFILANGTKILTAPGPGPGLQGDARAFDGSGAQITSFLAYPSGVDHGANVVLCDVDGDGVLDIITGPGPGPGYSAHVKGFRADGTPIPGLSFLAYPPGVFYGVNVACGDLDGDGKAEILTGPGPGAGLGAHVRAFSYNPFTQQVLDTGVSFLAYPPGVDMGGNVAGGDINGDGRAEILTGPGPGSNLGAHVRAFQVNTAGGLGNWTVTALPVSFLAYPPGVFYGVNVAAGDLDGDGRAEILTGPGPGSGLGAHVRAFRYNPSTQQVEDTGVSFLAYPPGVFYGVNVAAGDLDGDGRAEILTGPGPGSGNGPHVRAFRFTLTGIMDTGVSFLAYPPGTFYGVRVGGAGR